MAQCTAMSKRSGERCKHAPMTGSTLCHMHGGKTPVGIAAPTWKHGRYSAHMPKRMLAAYEKARIDPELLNLSDDIGAIESRITDVLSRVETGDAGETWQSLERAWSDFRIANAAKDKTKSALALATIGRIIETGAGDWAAWREVLNLIERRRKLVESEGKRRMQMADMTDNAVLMALLDRLGDAVKRHVTDGDALRAIQAEISPILGGGLPRRTDRGDE